MRNYAIILAGGVGSRAGGDLPKQFQNVGGKPMYRWSVEAFHAFDRDCRIVLVVHPDFIDSPLLAEEKKNLGKNFFTVKGGSTRFESVKNGLEFIRSILNQDDDAVIFIHDAARPCVTPLLISRGCRVVANGRGAVPAVPLTDSIRRLEGESSVAVDRSEFRAVQTPQIFLFSDIFAAYMSKSDGSGFTDDASVAESNGIEINLYDGDSINIKVTNPEDFYMLSSLK